MINEAKIPNLEKRQTFCRVHNNIDGDRECDQKLSQARQQ